MKKKTILISSLALSLVLSLGAVALTNNTSGLNLGAAEEGPIVWDILHAKKGTDEHGNQVYYTNYNNPIKFFYYNENYNSYFYNIDVIGGVKEIVLDFKNDNFNPGLLNNSFDIKFGYTYDCNEYEAKNYNNNGWTFNEATKEACFSFVKLGLTALPNFISVTYNKFDRPFLDYEKILISYGKLAADGTYTCDQVTDPIFED